MAGPTKLETLRRPHPRLDPFRVRVLRALYKGGNTLLGDDAVMKFVFPQSPLEHAAAYAERRARAFYDPEFAGVINKIIAGLAQDPLVFDDGGEGDGKEPDEGAKLSDYWRDLMRDATPPHDDGEPKTFDQVMNEAVTDGLVSGWSWVLVDLPAPTSQTPPTSLAEEDAAGARDAYPVVYPCASVLNWEEIGSSIVWVRTYSAAPAPVAPEEDRDFTRHVWKVWDAKSITTYQLDLNKDNKDRQGKEWKDEDVLVPDGDPQPHSFKRVPWVRFDFAADGEAQMHIGDMIESRCRSLFNEECGETYVRFRHMFQQLYEFLGKEAGGPDEVISENQQDPNRASKLMRSRSPDIIQVRGAEDDARFVSPDMSGAAVNRQALQEGRDAISRVTGQLAMSSDTSGAMIRRSGESKAQDATAEKIVLGVIGKKKRSCAVGVAELLAIGRGEGEAPAISGAEDFSIDNAMERVEEAVALSTAPVKSATFQVEHQFMLACSILGDALTPKIKAKIREELEGSISQEDIDLAGKQPIDFTPDGQPIDKSKGIDGVPAPLPPPPPTKPSPGKKK